MKHRFRIEFLEEVFDFLDALDEKTRNKIFFNMDKVKFKKDDTLFKKLTSDIWEFRTLFNKKQYRLFAFWDKEDNNVTIVVATHGIIKKTKKTPKKEIDKATELMKKHFKNKKKNK